jgi:hypothetical protein
MIKPRPGARTELLWLVHVSRQQRDPREIIGVEKSDCGARSFLRCQRIEGG